MTPQQLQNFNKKYHPYTPEILKARFPGSYTTNTGMILIIDNGENLRKIQYSDKPQNLVENLFTQLHK